MKFGLSIELSVPRPFVPGAESAVFFNALEHVRVADSLGFDQVWNVEHHFLEEYSHSSAPEMFLTAAAMQTERIHLCHGIVVCIPQFSNPIRIAERAAVLDILSHGRAEIGTGRSSTWTELGGFGVELDDTKKTWDEYVRMLPKMWMQERFSWESRSFSMPERAILPKPVQSPHPPMWVAVTSPGTELDAADRGLGCLGVTFGGVAAYEGKVKAYRKRIQNCDPVGAFVNEQVNAVNFLYCHEDDAHGVAVGQKLAAAFSSAAAQVMDVKEYPTATYLAPGLLSNIRRDLESPATVGGVPAGLCVGDPERIVAILKQWESAGVDRIIFLLNALEVIPQEDVLKSLRLFAAEVMPHFPGSDGLSIDFEGEPSLVGAARGVGA